MTMRYLVIGSWIDKQTGQPKAKVAEINEGVSKAGAQYGIADVEKSKMLDTVAKVGDIIAYDLVPV